MRLFHVLSLLHMLDYINNIRSRDHAGSSAEEIPRDTNHSCTARGGGEANIFPNILRRRLLKQKCLYADELQHREENT